MPAELFPSVPVRQGIKMALAGLLGFAIALWLRLPNPTWCIFTVVVLMLAQYVGAIAEKAILRAIGTFVGATIAVLLVGNFADSPTIMISVTFAVTAFGTMMFGGNWYPYAFFLGALTTLVVVGTTMESPADAWKVGGDRCQEIVLGILVSTAVTSVIWPRYARIEFRNCFRASLREAGEIAVARSRRLLDCQAEEPAGLSATELRFATRMNTLRLLLRYGQRESEYFRVKLPVRRQMTGELGALFEAAESLGQRLPSQSRYRDLISSELRAVQHELEREFAALGNSETVIERENAALTDAIAACDARLAALRAQGLVREIPVQEAMDFSAHYTALLDIAARLRVIRACLHEVHFTPETPVPVDLPRGEPLRVTPFWVRTGIKAGLTAVIALTYVNWIQPPGGLTIPFAAWLMTATARLYPGGQGDRRMFSYVITIALVGIPYAVILLLITPFLAHYIGINTFIAVGLFGLGYTIAKQGGIGLYTQCAMLFFIGGIGLNAQEPVNFQQIVGVYFGVVIALLISATVQRLFWPLLPQREICSLFGEFFACCRRLLGPLSPEEIAACEERIALIPSEVASWINVANTTEYPPGERDKLRALLRNAERLGYCILSTRQLARIETPPEIHESMRDHLRRVEEGAQKTLAGFEATFTRGAAPREKHSSQLAAFQPVETELSGIRQRYLTGDIQFPSAIAYLGAMNFVEDATRTLDRCAEQIGGLGLDRYRGDYAL